MIHLPRSLAEAATLRGELRAGGTDVMDRRRRGVSTGPVVDLRDVPGLAAIEPHDGGLRLGALTSVAAIAAHAGVARGWPALALAAGALATPQIAAAGTLGGNLLQRVRCAYYRSEDERCFQSGGDACPAREGVHDRMACFDLSPCLAPHPSTLALALIACDARVEVFGRSALGAEDLYGDGRDPSRSHVLRAGEILTQVVLPPPASGTRAGYVRASSRLAAEWPLADACVTLAIESGVVARARVAAGGVAPIPLRLRRVEDILVGRPPDAATAALAASVAADGANPLPALRYKLPLLEGVTRAALEQAMGLATP